MNLKYKWIFFKSFTFVIAVFLLMQSCSESTFEMPDEQNSNSELNNKSTLKPDEYRFIDKIYKLPHGVSKWEAQLNKVIETDSLLVQNGLKLMDYKYIRDIISIEDLEIVKMKLIEDNSSFVVYENDPKSFTIKRNKHLQENYGDFLNRLLPTSKDQLAKIPARTDESTLLHEYLFEKKDMGMVSIEWEYKGETLNTTCLVSKKRGIVYDKFLYFIRVQVNRSVTTQNDVNAARLNQTQLPPDGPIKRVWQISNDAYNYFGDQLWIYIIKCTLYGRRITVAPNQQIKYLDYPSLQYAASGSMWYDCKAEAKIGSFSAGADGHVSVSYAWAYGSGQITISYQGNGFSIDGAIDDSGGGTVYLTL